MIKKYRILFVVLIIFLAASLLCVLTKADIALLNPSGLVASKERSLMLSATLLMLIVVLPVFIFTFVFAFKYREGNKKAQYDPDFDHHNVIEFLWWLVPLIIITFISIIAFKSSHELDPFKPLNSDTKPVKIQVIALRWKWLFIYPEENIATVNFLQVPVNTPVNFEITADAPMNSFWIPKLGGQIYAMSGMSTKLHLMANEEGEYPGSSANISGSGFSGMKFVAKASSSNEYENWLNAVRQTENYLSESEYTNLALPSKNNAPLFFASTDSKLYSSVLMKYTGRGHSKSNGSVTHEHKTEGHYE